jgi:hypothetical protein
MADTNVIEMLRGQLREARDLVTRLETALGALEGSGLGSTRRRRPRRAAADGGMVGSGAAASRDVPKHGARKRRTFSAATRKKMAAAQKARWAKRKAEGKKA